MGRVARRAAAGALFCRAGRRTGAGAMRRLPATFFAGRFEDFIAFTS
jgi:hypothetical protein